MRQGILIALICAFTALAFWSVWNPGWYYLGRFVVFSLLGAVTVYTLSRGHRHAWTMSLVYLTAVVIVALVADLFFASPSSVESISALLMPIALTLSVATGLVAMTVQKSPDPSPGRPRSFDRDRRRAPGKFWL